MGPDRPRRQSALRLLGPGSLFLIGFMQIALRLQNLRLLEGKVAANMRAGRDGPSEESSSGERRAGLSGGKRQTERRALEAK